MPSMFDASNACHLCMSSIFHYFGSREGKLLSVSVDLDLKKQVETEKMVRLLREIFN